MSVREEMINSIHSMNKFYEWEWLREQTDKILLTLSHPLDREEYALRLKPQNKRK